MFSKKRIEKVQVEDRYGLKEELKEELYDKIFAFKVVNDFNSDLTTEEVNILATYMIVEWLGQQLASVENTRLKYSGSDFKFTSQANHMAKILALKTDYEREGFHLQRLYKRREINSDGLIKNRMDVFLTSSNE